MSKKLKIAITIFFIVVIVIIAIISTYFIIKNNNEKKQLEKVYNIYSKDKVEDRISKVTNEENEDKSASELITRINGKDVVGVIKIDRINFEGLIYEGTDWDTLARGVGHFENASYFDGNVCLAAHNTNKFWAKLHTLSTNDRITYTSFLGTREYAVFNITEIEETDWSLLQETKENILTLITCVKGIPSKRLCVQAMEVN